MLEEHDKKKFVEWLTKRISDNGLLIEQLTKLGSAMEPVKQSLLRENSAMSVVKHILETTQTMSIIPG